MYFMFFFSSRRRHTRCLSDWSSDVCSSDLGTALSICPENSNKLDRNKDLHILRIGANIIDSADSDNYPTVLALTSGGLPIRSEERRVGKECRNRRAP